MKDGHGTRCCRWFGHRLVYPFKGTGVYAFDWPPSMWLPDHGGLGGTREHLECARCGRKYTFVHGRATGTFEEGWR